MSGQGVSKTTFTSGKTRPTGTQVTPQTMDKEIEQGKSVTGTIKVDAHGEPSVDTCIYAKFVRRKVMGLLYVEVIKRGR